MLDITTHQFSKSTMFYSIRLYLFMFVVANLALAEDAHVTLWANGPENEKSTSEASLKLKPNETAYLVSWQQDEFRFSFINIWAGKQSATIQRKPEFEIHPKTKAVTQNGVLPLPALVVAGPATLKLSTAGQATAFCTFRIVQDANGTVKSISETASTGSNQGASPEPPTDPKVKP